MILTVVMNSRTMKITLYLYTKRTPHLQAKRRHTARGRILHISASWKQEHQVTKRFFFRVSIVLTPPPPSPPLPSVHLIIKTSS